ncbi:MAG: hypothetical protein LZF86_190257 [Nitrospira sp.]|nr:MAG: hypothetical protein LZF86_190257 [Nitrospira sp.]
MLRRAADGREGMQLVPLADLGPPIDRHMGEQLGPLPDRDMLADQTKRSDDHIVRQFRTRMHYCCRMNLHTRPPQMARYGRDSVFSSVTIAVTSASHTTSSST